MLIRIIYKLRTMKNNFYYYDTILDIVQPYDYPLPNKGDYINLFEKNVEKLKELILIKL